MKRRNTWVWFSEAAVYVNCAESLNRLIEEIIEYYFENPVQELTIVHDADQISFAFIDYEGLFREFTCGNNYQDFDELLHKLAQMQGKVEIFDIETHY